MKFFLHEHGWEGVVPYLATVSSPEAVDLLVTESANVLWKSACTGLIEKEQVPLLFSSMELLYPDLPIFKRKFLNLTLYKTVKSL